jgi:hypothetical protein
VAYQAVLVYDPQGEFLGYSVKADGAPKLHSTNIWSEDEKEKFIEQLNSLNQSVAITSAWPSASDPEVLEILSRENFMPVEEALVEVVDDDNSHLVYTQEPELDFDGQPTGNNVDGELDREASVFVYKNIMAPVRPSDVMERTKAACEIVAKRRSGQ